MQQNAEWIDVWYTYCVLSYFALKWLMRVLMNLLTLVSSISRMNLMLVHFFCNPYSISFSVLIMLMIVCAPPFLMGYCDESSCPMTQHSFRYPMSTNDQIWNWVPIKLLQRLPCFYLKMEVFSCWGRLSMGLADLEQYYSKFSQMP